MHSSPSLQHLSTRRQRPPCHHFSTKLVRRPPPATTLPPAVFTQFPLRLLLFSAHHPPPLSFYHNRCQHLPSSISTISPSSPSTSPAATIATSSSVLHMYHQAAIRLQPTSAFSLHQHFTFSPTPLLLYGLTQCFSFTNHRPAAASVPHHPSACIAAIYPTSTTCPSLISPSPLRHQPAVHNYRNNTHLLPFVPSPLSVHLHSPLATTFLPASTLPYPHVTSHTFHLPTATAALPSILSLRPSLPFLCSHHSPPSISPPSCHQPLPSLPPIPRTAATISAPRNHRPASIPVHLTAPFLLPFFLQPQSSPALQQAPPFPTYHNLQRLRAPPL